MTETCWTWLLNCHKPAELVLNVNLENFVPHTCTSPRAQIHCSNLGEMVGGWGLGCVLSPNTCLDKILVSALWNFWLRACSFHVTIGVYEINFNTNTLSSQWQSSTKLWLMQISVLKLIWIFSCVLATVFLKDWSDYVFVHWLLHIQSKLTQITLRSRCIRPHWWT